MDWPSERWFGWRGFEELSLCFSLSTSVLYTLSGL